MLNQHYFITGTDTDAGKTLVTCAFLYKAKQAGLSTLGLKPVAAGCTQTKAGLRNLDALRLIQQSSVQLAYDRVNPIALLPPIAPHIAAAKNQQHLNATSISQSIKNELSTQAQLALVEGAGGWCVPLNYQETLANVVQQLNLSVILVVGMKLGCLNHALLTAAAIKKDGLTLAGWVANGIDPNMAEHQANVDTLIYMMTHTMAAPCLGVIPFLESSLLALDAQTEANWQQKVAKAAEYIALPK